MYTILFVLTLIVLVYCILIFLDFLIKKIMKKTDE